MFVQIPEKDPVVIVFKNGDFFHIPSTDRCETFSGALVTESIPASGKYTLESEGGEKKKKGIRIQNVYWQYTQPDVFRAGRGSCMEVCRRPGGGTKGAIIRSQQRSIDRLECLIFSCRKTSLTLFRLWNIVVAPLIRGSAKATM
jgi:hypothetical protein